MEIFTIVIIALVAALLFSAFRVLREYERGVVFLLGRFYRVKGPGLVLIIPVVQQMVRVDLRTFVLDVPSQDLITRDNVSVKVNAVIYFRVIDADKSVIQVEDYNLGGQNVGYFDSTPGNTGGKFRTDDVDIQQCTDPATPAGQPCYNIGWTDAGEWLAYDVHVETPGQYTFTIRYATPSNGRNLSIEEYQAERAARKISTTPAS